MNAVEHAVAAPLPVPVIPLAPSVIESGPETARLTKPLAEILVYSPGPVLCRCGRYLSEDFDGRLFCRGCEGPDPSDITARLPLCYTPQS